MSARPSQLTPPRAKPQVAATRDWALVALAVRMMAVRMMAVRMLAVRMLAVRLAVSRKLAVSLFMAGVVVFAVSTGCMGYRMGARSLYRNDLRTVHVPMIESSSFRRNLGERLTEAVVKQIELSTPYKVVGDPSTAESVLRCQLISDRKDLSIETRTDEPRDLRLTFVVQVDWVDRFGQPLIQRTEIPMPSAFFGISQSTGLIAEAGQSMATQQQSALEGLARQIVGQLEAAW
ncbi:MAG: hypothetical protein RLY70_2764 [Planctomycetota bacterium]